MVNFLFILFSSICILSAIFVILSKNPIFCLLFLILCFCNVSCILFLFNFEFLPISFLIVYVGAIAVLFLFILMMINLKLAELNENKTSLWPLIMIFFILFLFEFIMILQLEFPFLKIYDNDSCFFLAEHLTNFQVSFNFVNLIFYYSNLKMIAYALFNDFLFCFLLSGFILLLAMIGAIILTLQKQFITKNQNVYVQILKDHNNSLIHYK